MKISEIINDAERRLLACGAQNPQQESEMLAEEVLGLDRLQLFLKKNDQADSAAEERFEALLSRRESGEPLQYILHKAYFTDLCLYVDENVLIPRPETEELAYEGFEFMEKRLNNLSSIDDKNLEILDLCTGSGALALAVKARFPKARVTASDISPAALNVAEKNAEALGEDIRFVHSDLFQNIAGRFDLILTNPPYIPSPMLEGLDSIVKDNEPMLALDGGEDGLDLIRIIIKEAPDHLKSGGALFIEADETHGEAASKLAEAAGFSARVKKDLEGKDRMLLFIKQNA